MSGDSCRNTASRVIGVSMYPGTILLIWMFGGILDRDGFSESDHGVLGHCIARD